MIIHATLQDIETGAIEETMVDAVDYPTGYEQLMRTVPEGMRLLHVRPER